MALTFPLSNVTAFPSRRRKGRPHTEEAHVCWNLGLLLGTDRQSFSFFFLPSIWVFVWNSVSPCLLSKGEAICTKKEVNYPKMVWQPWSDVFNVFNPSINPFSIFSTIVCTITWHCYTWLFTKSLCRVKKKMKDRCEIYQEMMEKKSHFLIKSIEIQEDVLGYSSNDCT